MPLAAATQTENIESVNPSMRNIPDLETLRSNYAATEQNRPLFYHWLREVHNVQMRIAHDLPDIYTFLSRPDQDNADFYRKYTEKIGLDENLTTTDQLQLKNRIVTHPAWNQVMDSPDGVRLTLVGPSHGLKNIDAALINRALWRRRGKRTTFVGIEPYPPEYYNRRIDPYYTQRLEDLARSSDEKNRSDIILGLGSFRMDIPLYIDRIDSTLALHALLKKGGYAVIDEACPPDSMPTITSLGAGELTNYDHNTSFFQASKPSLPPGYFERSWGEGDDEFGKVFYAEPLEVYFMLMQECGFAPVLAGYDEMAAMLQDKRLQRPWTRLEQLGSRLVKPGDTFSQIFYQAEDKKRFYDRYVLFWQKVGEPTPEIRQLQQELHGPGLFGAVVEE